MRKVLLNTFIAASLLLGSNLCRAAAPAAPQGAITAKEFLGLDLGNNALSVLTNDARFPNSPDVVAYPARFEWPTGPDDATLPPDNVKDGYGTQIIGYVYPPTTGNYVFYIAADDTANVFLSTDDNPANKRVIAFEPGWNPRRAWDATGNGRVLVDVGLPTERYCNVSSNIALVQGQAYYIEAIVKEGIGGDNLAVAWVLPGGQPPAAGDPPIPGQYLSTIDRVTLAQPFLRDFAGNGGGVWFYMIEPQDTINRSTVQLTLDGNPVTPVYSQVTSNLTISYRVTAPLAIGSTHNAVLNFNDSAGRPQSIQKQFVVASYATVRSALRTTTFSGDGMSVFVHQIEVGRGPGDGNSIANGETHLFDGFIDPATSQPYPNLATPPVNSVQTTVNWEQAGGDINATGGQPDNFNSIEPEALPKPNNLIPGIPGSATNPDNNIAASITMYLELKQGWNRLGVNSDDGFTLRVSSGAGETVGGTLLASFNGGRGASDSLANFWVEADGVYPARLSWWEGTGGANVEFFSENIETGARILINDRAVAGHLKAYPTGTGGAYVKQVSPYPGKTGVGETNTQVRIQIVDGATTLVPGSLILSIDGTVRTNANIVSAGGTTTLTWSNSGKYALGTSHTGYFIWQESTTPVTTHSNALSFVIRQFDVNDLPLTSFWIEGEDFNHGGGQTVAAASTMPYAGGAYDQLGAVFNIDYNRPQEPSSDLYRVGEDPNVSMDPNNTTGTLDVQRIPGFEVTTNYKMGWTAGGAWYNYTRTIPAGLYTAFGAFSHGDVGADIGGSLQRVTAGATTTSQTVVQLGAFSDPAPGGWGNNTMVPLRDASGGAGVFKLPGGPVTLRLTTRNGDYDWFILVPVSGVPPSVTSISPPLQHTVYRDATFTWTIEDFSTAVATNSIRLTFGGADVSSQLSITKPASDLTTVSYKPAQLLNSGGSYAYELVFRDNGTPQTSKTNSGTIVAHYLPRAAVDGAFAIEAEDFNYGSGQWSNVVNTMPYAGGAYTNLSAVVGVDYQRNNEPAGDVYRIGENPNVPMGGATGTAPERPGTVPDITRAGWDITQNFSLGWAGGNQWLNYTRQIPANTYQVWAAMSYDGTAANQLSGNLLQVTSGATTPTQTTVPVGVFRGPGSAGWGANALVPMRDTPTSTAIKTVQLSGEVTLRFENASGDFDYLMLIPTGAAGPVFGPTTITGGNVIISWTGAGTLQQATALTGSPSDWSDVAGNPTSPYTASPTGLQRYFRLRP